MCECKGIKKHLNFVQMFTLCRNSIALRTDEVNPSRGYESEERALRQPGTRVSISFQHGTGFSSGTEKRKV